MKNSTKFMIATSPIMFVGVVALTDGALRATEKLYDRRIKELQDIEEKLLQTARVEGVDSEHELLYLSSKIYLLLAHKVHIVTLRQELELHFPRVMC